MPVAGLQTLQRDHSLGDQVMGTRFHDAESQKREIFEHYLEAKFLVPNRIERVVLYYFRFMLGAIDRYADQLDFDVSACHEIRWRDVLAGNYRERQMCRMQSVEFFVPWIESSAKSILYIYFFYASSECKIYTFRFCYISIRFDW